MKPPRSKHVPPSVRETSFNCPHCGALAKQFWHSAYAVRQDKDAVPLIATADPEKERIIDSIEDDAARERLRTWYGRKISGIAFLWEEPKDPYTKTKVENLNISRCYNCDHIAIWIYDRILWPESGEGPLVNPDLPEDLLHDYSEASAILNRSPRGAAALLRLVIQKLCAHVAKTGKGLNADIAELAKRDLAPTIVQALDAVRVVGNNAVHPLEMDLRDDRATAETLFGLVNIIVDNLISRPKQVEAIYAKLPSGAVEAIKKRDSKPTPDGNGG